MRFILTFVTAAVIGSFLGLGIGSAVAQDSTPSSVAKHALQICPTAVSPEQCIVDFASVITEARIIADAEAVFRRKYPDPKFGSLEIYRKSISVMKRWTEASLKHDRRWSR